MKTRSTEGKHESKEKGKPERYNERETKKIKRNRNKKGRKADRKIIVKATVNEIKR
jgi:hypothetical protein